MALSSPLEVYSLSLRCLDGVCSYDVHSISSLQPSKASCLWLHHYSVGLDLIVHSELSWPPGGNSGCPARVTCSHWCMYIFNMFATDVLDVFVIDTFNVLITDAFSVVVLMYSRYLSLMRPMCSSYNLRYCIQCIRHWCTDSWVSVFYFLIPLTAGTCRTCVTGDKSTFVIDFFNVFVIDVFKVLSLISSMYVFVIDMFNVFAINACIQRVCHWRIQCGSHSLRRGGATAAAARAIRVHILKRHGRWASDAVYLYIQDPGESRVAVSRAILHNPWVRERDSSPSWVSHCFHRQRPFGT